MTPSRVPEPIPVCRSPGNSSVCRTGRPRSRGGDGSPLPCSPRTPCRPRQRPAWSGTCSPPCTTACCRRSAEKRGSTGHRYCPGQPIGTNSTHRERMAPCKAPPPAPREPFGAPRARVTSGRTLAYIHVVTEGGVGAVLQPALVAHVVEDARGHQGVVQHLPGRGVIQAQPPAPAERERSQRHHHRPRTLRQPLMEELNSSLTSHHDEKQLGFPADRTPALQSTPELLQDSGGHVRVPAFRGGCPVPK